ncbi:MAG: HAMP domain-containing histidine kinase [Angelakisella sp.]|nr:HAMP domain-containing histidine kinase [Angelakisella sp.]
MAKKRMKKITKRWLINSFGVVLVIVAVMVVATSVSVHSYYYNGARQFLLSRSDAVATLLENYSRDSSVDFSVQLRRLVEDYEYKDKAELMAISGDKKVLITSSGFEPEEDQEMPDYDQAYSSQTGVGEFVGYVGNEKVMAVTVMSRIISDDLSAMRYVVSLTRIDQQIVTTILFICLLGLAIILFVLYSSLYFINSIIIPIGEVGQTAKQIAQGDLGVRILVEKDDEIGELCASINNMAEELSNAEKVKNDFISSVSHELRTPLTAIRGWGETLLDSGEPDRDTFRKGMRVIMEETERLSSMVEELLDFSRMQSGRLVMEKERLDAVAELSDAVLIFTERARQENKALEYQEPEFFAPVLGDHNRLRQVFINILDNALKYSDSGDAITVLPRLAEGAFLVTVSDTGCGISEEDLPMVKTRFYKGHTTRRGSGIGLAVADEIIRMHGGTLTLDSVKDKGTTVSITLPLEAPQG